MGFALGLDRIGLPSHVPSRQQIPLPRFDANTSGTQNQKRDDDDERNHDSLHLVLPQLCCSQNGANLFAQPQSIAAGKTSVDITDDALTIDEIRELAKSPLVTIGAHSHCHSMLPTLPAETAIQSIAESKRLLEEWISQPVIHFSYPNGDHDEAVVNMVKECGFSSAVTTRPDFWCSADSVFKIPRMGIGRYDSLDKFKYRTARPTGR